MFLTELIGLPCLSRDSFEETCLRLQNSFIFSFLHRKDFFLVEVGLESDDADNRHIT